MNKPSDSRPLRSFRDRLRSWGLLPRGVDPLPWLNTPLLEELFNAGLRTIPSLDVPAAAAVIYRETVIIGWNDVAASTNAAGHAELNAITRAMQHFGSAQAFKNLNRDELYLVTTYEPCPMCTWALCEYGFRPENIVVLQLKEREERLRERRLFWRMRRRWRVVPHPEVSQKLFCSHPGYRAAYPHRCPPEMP